MKLNTPYGGELVDLVATGKERDALLAEANTLPSLQISDRSVHDLELLAVGSPLWPLPITLPVADNAPVQPGAGVTLRNSKNELLRAAGGGGERPPHPGPPGRAGVRAGLRAPPRPLRAVLFDWDGTIVDSAEASYRCYVRLFESYQIPFNRERFQRTYSPEWYRTYAALGLPWECWDEADARWLGFYAAEENVMLGGAREALQRLRQPGIALGIVTSGTRARVARELEGLGLRDLFRVVVSAEDVEKRKPDPEPIVRGLEALDVPAAEAACVGDSPEDVEMARAAGVYVVGVPGPFPNREELRASSPDLLVDSLDAVVRALLDPEAV